MREGLQESGTPMTVSVPLWAPSSLPSMEQLYAGPAPLRPTQLSQQLQQTVPTHIHWLPSPARVHGQPVFWAAWELQSHTPWSALNQREMGTAGPQTGKLLGVSFPGHPPEVRRRAEHRLPSEGSCSLASFISPPPHSLIMLLLFSR